MPADQAVARVRDLISRIGDPRERCQVQMVLDARIANSRMPAWSVMTPLMRVADLILRGITS